MTSPDAQEGCPFCQVPSEQVIVECESARALRDLYPVTLGHTLIVPRRHVTSLFSLTPGERDAIWDLLSRVRERLLANFSLDGLNIGINDGEAAGQTVPHTHVHVIPRRSGDVEDPRGGVRWIIPNRAPYWVIRDGGDAV